MVKGVKAIKRRTNKCQHCGNEFKCHDKKAKCCDDCKSKVSRPCACGCGKIVTRPKFKMVHNSYWISHDKRGKTYADIYGDIRPACGFKPGLLNVNFTKPKYRRFKYVNSIGEKFSSKLEVAFSEFLILNGIKYATEVKIPLKNGRLKIIDFLVDDFIMVEITGFAYDKWQDDFIMKMKWLRESVDNPILISTYQENLDDIHNHSRISICKDIDVFIEAIENTAGLLKKIQLFKSIQTVNKLLYESTNN